MCLLYAAIFLSYFIDSFQCEFSDFSIIQTFFNRSILGSNVSVSDLPPIFHIDENYEKCKEQGKLFCKVTIVLQNGNSTSPYWKLIEETIQDPRSYNHNELFQAICIEDFCPEVEGWKGEAVDSLKPYLSQCYAEKYKHLGLIARVSALRCSRRDIEYQAGILDYSILSVVMLFISDNLCNTIIYYLESMESYTGCSLQGKNAAREKTLLDYSDKICGNSLGQCNGDLDRQGQVYFLKYFSAQQ
ncbi:unnamed protein product [Callosobruchus maculatus]|uniref:Uncharacterized protein n=1 Tax=Callosobruchus maculatus TaxID=64391 RepID=A0A653C522_CALMS|nr:unnamed protein product [Callosobruchus maculatus]